MLPVPRLPGLWFWQLQQDAEVQGEKHPPTPLARPMLR
jgi:hypothetical protein